MNCAEKRRAFLGRPMRAERDLSADFFEKVQDTLVAPALQRASEELPFDLELELSPPHPSQNILEMIVQRVEMSEICVFDITNCNPNVLFECGLRRAVSNAPVVLIACREATPEVPFDITYESIFHYGRDDILSKNVEQAISNLSRLLRDALEVAYSGPRFVNTDYVYTCYGRLTPQDELLVWVATWPAFPETWREERLLKCSAGAISIVGPVNSVLQLPGIFWRLSIRDRCKTTTNAPFNVYGKDLPPTKLIVAGNEMFLAPEASTRTARYYRTGPTSAEHKDLYLKSLQGARPVEESVYLLLYQRLQDQGQKAMTFEEMMGWFVRAHSDSHVPLEQTQYDENWVARLFKDWIPRCVMWANTKRGWTRLRVRKHGPDNDFRLELGYHGRHLEQRHFNFLRRDEARELPRIRFIVTNSCENECSYCPPENEDYAGSKRLSMTQEEIKCLFRSAYACGFRKFSVTGGEPLQPRTGQEVIAALRSLLTGDYYMDASVALQTNGQHLASFLPDIRDLPRISLKISWHATYKTNGTVAEAVEAACEAGLPVALNYVIMRQTVNSLQDVIRWASGRVSYLKLLDLSWYEDIGLRGHVSELRSHGLKGDLYWRAQYLSPREVYEDTCENACGPLTYVRTSRYGIPMLETSRDKSGFFIRIKDSAMGSCYAPDCHSCQFFVDKRRCQEGVYQLWITPAMRLKICRHRNDLFSDISDAVDSRDDEVIQSAITAMVGKFYTSSRFVGLE